MVLAVVEQSPGVDVPLLRSLPRNTDPSARVGESKPGDRMKDKMTVRYLGYRALAEGGRGFDFSVAVIGEKAKQITIEASADLFRGPNRIAIQEGAGICYETLRSRIETDPTIP